MLGPTCHDLKKEKPTNINFLFFQFCEVGAMVIIQKKTQPHWLHPSERNNVIFWQHVIIV
jgi:hypothetical protein